MVRSWRMRWVGQVLRTGERRNAYIILTVKPEGKKQLRRPECRWEDNIKMDLRKTERGLDISGSDRDQWWVLVNTAN
jgi:hypothetical protein